MAPTTRAQRTGVPTGPPPLRRMSAVARIRFTRSGRRDARRLLLDDRAAYYLHFEIDRDGRKVFVLECADAAWWTPLHRRVVLPAVPDHVHDVSVAAH